MPESAGGQTARQWLERQLEELGSLYNAGVRSPNFREWRQATLTSIQRIWPGDPAKSERFRRIPFSPPMGRPGEREVREYYERGCGEAASLLKGYIAEIASLGLPSGAGPAAGGPAPPAAGADEDGFPTVDLPGPGETSTGRASGRGAGSASPPPKPRLKDLLGFSDTDPADIAPQHQAPPPAPTPEPAAGHDSARGGTHAVPGLEHGFFAPPTPGAHEVVESPPAASAPHPTPSPRIVVTGTEHGAPPAGPTPHAPEPVAMPPEPAAFTAGAGADPAARGVPGGDYLERMAEELLRATSALSAVPRRATADRRAAAREIRSPVAIAVAALALDVETLGVPEGHRARTRAALLDLSRQLDAPNLSWETLREAMTFAMELPALARRVVPLLVTYLDRAA